MGLRGLVTAVSKAWLRASMPVQAATRGGWERVRSGIENGDAGGGLGIAAGHFLMGGFIGDQGEGLALAAGAGGGGDGDQGEHRPRRLAHAPVVLHAAAIGEEKVAALGGVQAAAPAQPDETVNARAAGGPQTGGHVAGGRGFRALCQTKLL